MTPVMPCTTVISTKALRRGIILRLRGRRSIPAGDLSTQCFIEVSAPAAHNGLPLEMTKRQAALRKR